MALFWVIPIKEKMSKFSIAFLGVLLLFFACRRHKTSQYSNLYDVLVIGGGTSGIAAGLQSARLGAKTLICEPTPWLGGMISTAGVSATDGNHRLPSGIWRSFREALYAHYGGAAALETGWVSNTQFEPHVADSIFKAMAHREQHLSIRYGCAFQNVLKTGRRVTGAVLKDKEGNTFEVRAKIVIDATELGDVFANAGASYDLGVDARAASGERFAPEKSSPAVQDLTWAAILKDYGPGADKTLPADPTYNPAVFQCCCADRCPDAQKVHPCTTMLSYARLPNGKIMMNWPRKGNDTYLNVVEANDAHREAAYKKARTHTLHFIRYIQQELGYKNLGLADDEYPTPDRLPFIPYHREGRRVKGIVRLNVHHILSPFDAPNALYRTGIAVGDYPLDHHHAEAPEPIEEEYPPIPSFNVPLGTLVPETTDGLVVAEKGISVTHLVNGATRLQPCVLLIGQAAGTLAAVAAQTNSQPRQIGVRKIQQKLLESGAFLMPYLDVSPDDPAWQAIQKVGATGILRGKGIPHDWANETWFYPDSTIFNVDFISTLQDWQPGFFSNVRVQPQPLTVGEVAVLLETLLSKSTVTYSAVADSAKRETGFLGKWLKKEWEISLHLKHYDENRLILRRELAVLTDTVLNPFARPVSWTGVFLGTE